MKYQARFSPSGNGKGAQRFRSVELVLGARLPEVVLDGRRSRYDAVATAPDTWSILGPDGRQVDATVHRDGQEVRVHIGGAVVEMELVDELTARALATTGRKAGARAADVKAAIPGRVLRVLVAPGDEVTDGMPVLVLEAMKMENEVRAKHGGTVVAVEVQAGQAVGTGDVLIRLGPAA